MSAEDFQLIDSGKKINQLWKEIFKNVYHHHRAQTNDEIRVITFFGENPYCIQRSQGYLEFKITVRTADNTSFIFAFQ